MTITEQLDALVLNNEEIVGWSVVRVKRGYYCSVWGTNGTRGSDIAPTLPEAAEQATLKAMAAMHEGRNGR